MVCFHWGGHFEYFFQTLLSQKIKENWIPHDMIPFNISAIKPHSTS